MKSSRIPNMESSRIPNMESSRIPNMESSRIPNMDFYMIPDPPHSSPEIIYPQPPRRENNSVISPPQKIGVGEAPDDNPYANGCFIFLNELIKCCVACKIIKIA